jgi:hypothetical protein
MLTCKKCGNGFKTSIVVDGKRHYLNKRKYCLECSPFGTQNRRKLEGIGVVADGCRFCSLCKKVKPNSEFYTRSKSKWLRGECKECSKQDRKKRLEDFKAECVEYKGGKCQVCGYSRYFGSMDFHHTDPKKKDFSISNMRFGYKVTQGVKDELDKCVLVCCRCHREIGAGLTECPKIE